VYHEFDPLGRGYHFRVATEKRQVEMVQAVMKFRPEEILDKDKHISMPHFYAFVWHHRFEIGSKLNEAQKAEFPRWMFDVTPVKYTSLQQKLEIKNNFGVVIGQIAVDEKQIPGKLVLTYNDTPPMKVEPFVTDNNQISTRYLKNPESQYPKVMTYNDTPQMKVEPFVSILKLKVLQVLRGVSNMSEISEYKNAFLFNFYFKS
jgi:hypothetical protein